MNAIEQFITWKDNGFGQICAWFDHKAANEAGLVRRDPLQDSRPCYTAESIDMVDGKFHLVEDGADFDTLEDAKTAAIASAVEFILG